MDCHRLVPLTDIRSGSNCNRRLEARCLEAAVTLLAVMEDALRERPSSTVDSTQRHVSRSSPCAATVEGVALRCRIVCFMESSLHRELKLLYGGTAEDVEVQVDGFRIDAVVDGTLYEIQQASLGALREKVRTLLNRHTVVVVKPLASRKLLVRRAVKDGPVVSSRFSPTRETVFHFFADMVYFVDVFPHKRLTIEVVLTEQEEHRITKVRRRRFGPDYRVDDRRLRNVVSRLTLRTVADLRALLPTTLESPFTTADLAREARIPRWIAQKMAYCLRETGAVENIGKRGREMLYDVPQKRRRRAA